MIEPKTFYRKLDSLLDTIGKKSTGKRYLETIVSELEKTFAADLHISNGRIYEKTEDEYILIYADQTEGLRRSIPIASEEIDKIIENRLYLFHDCANTNLVNDRMRHCAVAAITVHNPDQRWIFVFDLSEGWSREEIEFCFNAVRSATNQRLFSDSFKNELEQSVHIQQSLLPTTFPEVEGFQIAAKSAAAELVGGDLYDFHEFDNQGFGFCIGDASGHGISSALMVRDVVTGLRMGVEKHMKMVYTIKKLNKVINRSVFASRFVSLFYGELEPDGNLFYTNAGHPSPIVLRGNDIISLDSSGIVLGALPEIQLKRSHILLEKGDVLLLYTDGIPERMNKFGNEFGMERFIEIVKKEKNKTAGEIVEAIFNNAAEFGNNSKWKDDVTVMIIKYLE